jgi:hypothetical protein
VALGLATVLETKLVLDAPAPVRFGTFVALTALGALFKVQLPGQSTTLSASFFFLLLGIPQLSMGETIILGVAGCVVQCFSKRTGRPDLRTRLLGLSLSALAPALSWKLFHAGGWGVLGIEYPVRIMLSSVPGRCRALRRCWSTVPWFGNG